MCEIAGLGPIPALRARELLGDAVVKLVLTKGVDGLCGHHHDLKSYFGWALVDGTGQRPMVPPDDPRHPKNKPK